jgi:hypothetical protein
MGLNPRQARQRGRIHHCEKNILWILAEKNKKVVGVVLFFILLYCSPYTQGLSKKQIHAYQEHFPAGH